MPAEQSADTRHCTQRPSAMLHRGVPLLCSVHCASSEMLLSHGRHMEAWHTGASSGRVPELLQLTAPSRLRPLKSTGVAPSGSSWSEKHWPLTQLGRSGSAQAIGGSIEQASGSL